MKTLCSTACAALGLLALVFAARAQEPAASLAPPAAPAAPAVTPPATVELEGAILITQDFEGRIRALRLVDEKSGRVYHVRVDAKAAELARVDTKRPVKAAVTLEPKPDGLGRTWVTVKEFTVAGAGQRADAAAPAGRP